MPDETTYSVECHVEDCIDNGGTGPITKADQPHAEHQARIEGWVRRWVPQEGHPGRYDIWWFCPPHHPAHIDPAYDPLGELEEENQEP